MYRFRETCRWLLFMLLFPIGILLEMPMKHLPHPAKKQSFKIRKHAL